MFSCPYLAMIAGKESFNPQSHVVVCFAIQVVIEPLAETVLIEI